MNRLKGPLYLFGAFSLAGSSVVAAQYLSGKLGTFSITAVSLLLALLFLAPFCGRRIWLALRFMSSGQWLMLLFQAACGIFLFRLLLLQGLLRTSAGEAGILTGITPAATAILAWALIREPLNKKSLVGIISTVCGVLIIQGILVKGGVFSIQHAAGNLLVICAALSESLFSVLCRVASIKANIKPEQAVDPLVQTALVCLAALVMCLVPAFFEHPLSALAKTGPAEWLALAWYGVVVTALGFILWYAGISRCRASVAAAFSGMMPLVALLLSMLILGDRFGWQQWSGGLLVVVGMMLAGSRGTTVRSKAVPLKIETQRRKKHAGI
jgi:drug/metabolite transporter (DMT)-like permease